MAFSLTPNGGKQQLGVATLHGTTIADVATRTVVIKDLTLTSIRFPSLDQSASDTLRTILRESFPARAITINLDLLLAQVEAKKAAAEHPVVVNLDPPPIFVSNSPAILLFVDGKPVEVPIQGTSLKFIANTNSILFAAGSGYFLLNNKTWLTAKDLKGPWEMTQQLPPDINKLPANTDWDDVKKALPPAPGIKTQVFFTDKPAELLVFHTSPVYEDIPGTKLLYVTNTSNDVFKQVNEQQFYVLLSGRWFRAASLDGPWAYAGNDLPQDFKQIPPTSPAARVLASVPGTQQAEDAVLLAQVPTTAVVNKAEAEAKVKVTYGGAPQFKPITGTTLEYATNTPDKVVKVGDLYYLCFQAVWFMSTTPQGPWKTADSVPKEIYEIPPTSPVYNVTYVTVSNPTPVVVESSYTAGYVGMFVIGAAVGATVVYGSGYYYPPYYWYGPYPYPIYYPYPYTYGVGAVYNPYTGGYAVGGAVYGPYGAAGGAAWYNPATGTYGRVATVQTPYGGRTVASAYNPYTGAYAATRQGSSPYAQWGSSVAVRGDDWARAGHVTTSQGTVAGVRTSNGTGGVVATGPGGNTGGIVKTQNDVYAGKDGNVYKKDSNGNWSKYDNGNWDPVTPPNRPSQQPGQTQSQPADRRASTNTTGQNRQQPGTLGGENSAAAQNRSNSPGSISPDTMGQLNRDAASRQTGAQRERNWSQNAGSSSARTRGTGGRRRR